MSDKQNARERLDALLTGLEDEVVRDEAVAATDVETMRLEIEGLIEGHVPGSGVAPVAARKTGHVKQKAPGVMELLGRWAGLGQGAGRRGATPRVRMAFSAERERAEGGSDRGPGCTRDGARGENERRET